MPVQLYELVGERSEPKCRQTLVESSLGVEAHLDEVADEGEDQLEQLRGHEVLDQNYLSQNGYGRKNPKSTITLRSTITSWAFLLLLMEAFFDRWSCISSSHPA